MFLDENFGIGIFLKVGKIIGHLFSACFNSLVWSSMKITFLGLIFFVKKYGPSIHVITKRGGIFSEFVMSPRVYLAPRCIALV